MLWPKTGTAGERFSFARIFVDDGLLFTVAIVSGLVVYPPFLRKLDFGTVRASRSARLKWLDYHNLLAT